MNIKEQLTEEELDLLRIIFKIAEASIEVISTTNQDIYLPILLCDLKCKLGIDDILKD